MKMSKTLRSMPGVGCHAKKTQILNQKFDYGKG